MKKAFLLILICFVLISAITIIFNKKSSNKTQTVLESISNEENKDSNEENKEAENIIYAKYKEGFARGYNRYLTQTGKESETVSIKEYKYTSNIIENISEEEKENLCDIEMKGYVDGYHKAGEMQVCPRGN